MNKSGTLGMRLHQALSFSGALMRCEHRKAIFWPGCALMSADPELLKKTFLILRRAEPEIGFSSCCCAQPTEYLFTKKFAKRQAKLCRMLKTQGVERVYTACPNCAVSLKKLGCVEVIPVWETLDEYLRKEDILQNGGAEYALHDPCPARKETAQHAAVRSILKKAGVSVAEFPHNRGNTICCGNYHMMRALDPEKSASMRKKRLAEAPDAPITSYCAGCLDAFSSEGKQCTHLLELLFGKSDSRGWGNRIKFTSGIKKRP